jgi:CHAD domain-containing protein
MWTANNRRPASLNFTVIEGLMTDNLGPTDGKWVNGLSAGVQVGKAARLALTARLATVHTAVKSATEWGPDPEPVHRLRVATRRATAALDVFADVIPGKAYRKARRALKRLRRAAGAARDADVFLDAVRAWAVHQSPADRPGLHFLLGHAFARRQAAQTGLRDAIEKWQLKAEGLHCFADKSRNEKREPLGERAVTAMIGLVGDFDAAAGAEIARYRQLHQVRILGKQMRYTLELFFDCFPAAVHDRVYPRVEAVQAILGDANDSQRAAVQLGELLDEIRRTQPGSWDLVRGGIERLQAHHQLRVREQRTAFLNWWRSWQALRPDAMLAGVKTPAKLAEEPPVPSPAAP